MPTYTQDGQLVMTNDTPYSLNQPGGVGFTQASVGGINLETGQPIGGTPQPLSSFTPQQMNDPNFVRSGLNSGYYQAPASAAPAGGMMSNSDQFMASARSGSGVGAGRVASVMPNSASTGANYNTGMLNNLIASYQRAQSKAQADSLAQYQQLMKGVQGTTADVNGLLGQLGKTGETRIAENEKNQIGQAEQDAVSRGLGNTTIRQSMIQGVQKNAEQARQSLSESVAGQKIGVKMNLAQMYGDAVLSRQNIAPGSDYLSLISQLGAAGGGGGGALTNLSRR
jgi:hypothetical protein